MTAISRFLVAFENLTGRKPSVDLVKFKEIVSPEYFVSVRARFGGPARARPKADFASRGQSQPSNHLDRKPSSISTLPIAL